MEALADSGHTSNNSKPKHASTTQTLHDVANHGSLTQKRLASVLHTPVFEVTMGFVIIANTVTIVAETDHGANHDDDLLWVTMVGSVILMVFIVELACRMFVFRHQFWNDHWNTFDFGVVFGDTLLTVFGMAFGNALPVSTLRIFRLGKLARITKVFRAFPELRLMMAGLLGSMRSIFWGAVLLGFMLLVWAIIAVQLIHPLNQELAEKGYLQDCERCPRAYASTMQAFLTFSQQIVAGDSWGQATIPLIEHYPATALYFMGVFLSIGIACLNLILGVVVNVAQSEHERLKLEMEDEQRMERLEVHNHLLEMCREMDTDGSGELSQDEILQGFRDHKEFRSAFQELDIDEEDMPIVFNIMDTDKSGSLSYTEFVSQIYKLKATDTQFMLAHIKHYISKISEMILSQMNAQKRDLDELNEGVAAIEAFDDEIQQLLECKEEALMDGDSKDVESTAATNADAEGGDAEVSNGDCHGGGHRRRFGSVSAGHSRNSIDEHFKTIAEEYQKCTEVVSSFNELQSDLRGVMEDLKLSLELQATSASSMFSELLPRLPLPGDDLLAVPEPASSSSMCCRPTAPIIFKIPSTDKTPKAPASKLLSNGDSLPPSPPSIQKPADKVNNQN